jgi:lantibiotic modifying enzyme
MLAAWHLYEATGEASWRDLFLENVEQVWKTWLLDARMRCHVWTQALYGKVVHYLGAGHGFAGNAYPLLKGASLLEESRREVLYERSAATVRATARVADGGANWPPDLYDAPSSGAGMLMQWCHGAPGVVTAMAEFPPGRSRELDVLLKQAGEAIWQAGPLTKGYGLCHGTAGNGYAFLQLFKRTGERIWLDRARSFAMHAFTQQDRTRKQYGRGRYALWTGDPGLAVYAWHCIRGSGGLPALDVLQ